MFTALHDVSRVGERRPNIAGGIAPGVAAGMIKMQVRIDHERDIIGREARLHDAGFEGRPSRQSVVLNAIDFLELRRFLVPDAAINQHQSIVMFDEQTAHTHGNAILRVGSDAALPQRLGHYAKHGAAVELLSAGLDRVNLPATERSGIEQWLRKAHAT